MLKPCLHSMLLTGITEAVAEELRYWQVHHHDYKKTCQSFLCCLSQHDGELRNAVSYMDGGKLVMWPEADEGDITIHDEDPDSELPLTLFDGTHLGLAAVKVDMFQQPTSHPNLRQSL